MDRAKIIRRVRIASAALCLLFCAAFVVLWVRSYRWVDSAHCPLPGESVDSIRKRWVRRPDGTRFVPSPKMLTMTSFEGRISVYAGEDQPGVSGWFPWGWGMDTYYIGDNQRRTRPLPMWQYDAHLYGRYVLFPHWAPALLFAFLGVPIGVRRPYRFSLRTLLIASTLVALILGLLVWASGK